jgi:hypothetical protein
MRYVQVVKMIANIQIGLWNAIAAALILLSATNGMRPIVLPNLHTMVPETIVCRRHMRYQIMVVDKSPVIWKHEI